MGMDASRVPLGGGAGRGAGGVPAGCAGGVAEHGSPHRALAAWVAQGWAQSGCRGGLGAMGELGTSTQVSRMGVVEGGGLIA